DLASPLPEAAAGPFDLVYVGQVLMYLEDDVVERLAAEVAQRLRPGGRLIVKESVRRVGSREGGNRFEGLAYSVLYRGDEEYPAIFGRAGLRLVRRADLAGFPTLDLLEKALSRLGVASHGNVTRKLSPESPLWARFVERVTPAVVRAWPL